ncbi:MAG TPA: putative toxin-antitoxin system toxin component, PIN family [Longimicrobium sp.]|jgi:putative PIN family toxin of toxin-antitoxin system
MRIVLDTSVFVAALRSNSGASNRLVQEALHGRYTLLVSVPLLLEYEAVLSREEHLAASGVTPDDVGVLLDAIASVAEQVRLSFLWRPTLRDEDDEVVLETAINGRADRLVTFNVKDFDAAPRFGVAVVTPGEALRSIERKQ